MRNVTIVAVGLLCATSLVAAEVDYAREVKPILARCQACHGAVRQKGKLRLDAVQLVRKGGRNGPAITPGKSGESLLIDAVLGKDRPRMPPEKEGEALKPAEIEKLRAWIDQGAKAADEPIPPDPREHWAYQPPVRPTLPPSKTKNENPVDAFVNAKREQMGVRANAPADRATLLRRVYLDLIGLPPTRAELHAFLADSSTDAYEKVVDRLLASPRYGERWGRHWMDVWRYSDPFGLGEEYRYSQRHIWRWRDWIIESLNADKGYDRMIVEMLAGDEVAPADRDTLRATGYLARNWYKFNRNVWIQDTVEYTAAGFFGITLRCARCHDHKYDPIAQEDYYRFRAFFEPHDVRIDLVPGQADPTKDGVARAFDAKPAEPTYLFKRGDERTPDKSQALTVGTPAVLGNIPVVKKFEWAPSDLARALPRIAAEARAKAEKDIAAAESAVQAANEVVAQARGQLDDLAAGKKPMARTPPDFLSDNFAKPRPDVWQIVRGGWTWENGRLQCKTPGVFLTLTTKSPHPQNLMGRVRYRATGGTIGSVGIGYDVVGTKAMQAIYTAGSGSNVQAFHRFDGAEEYPATGVFPGGVKFNEDATLDFAVRGTRLNVWVNGVLRIVYTLPKARQAGVFSLWTHEAIAEFREVRLAALPDSVPLAEKLGENRPSPLDGPVVLTKADAEKALRQAEQNADLLSRRLAVARADLAAVNARALAERMKYELPATSPEARTTALAAGKAERHAALLRAEIDLSDAEQAATLAKAMTATDAKAKKTLADAEAKVVAVRKALDAARAALGKDDPTFTPLVKLDPATSTGRRLALAQWITDRKNPLTARVAVNQMWMRHFGRPLVGSVANFGLAGKKPTHPELLDWLAVEFMESGWSMKKLHRLLVTSDTYRLSSQVATDDPRLKTDGDNQWLWRMNPRRMEAEVVRDSVLALAGQLDTTMGGPILDEKTGQTSRRRSVYFRFNTEYKMQFLDQFDAASPTECYERRESIIPQQALALHNSALALTQARHLAGVLSDGPAGASPSAFVAAAFEQVLNRPPTAAERERAERFLREQAELVKNPARLTAFPAIADRVPPPSADPARRAREGLIQVLLNHNDFVTIR